MHADRTRLCKATDAVYTVGLLVLFPVDISYVVKGSYDPFLYFDF